MAGAIERARVRPVPLLIVVLTGLLIGIALFSIVRAVTTPRRTTPVYDPPVLAGQQIPMYCSGGVYARRGETIVLTSSPHCGGEGTKVYDFERHAPGYRRPDGPGRHLPASRPHLPRV